MLPHQKDKRSGHVSGERCASLRNTHGWRRNDVFDKWCNDYVSWMLSGFMQRVAGWSDQFGRPGFNDVGNSLRFSGNIAHVHEEFVDGFRVDVEGLIEAAGDAGNTVRIREVS